MLLQTCKIFLYLVVGLIVLGRLSTYHNTRLHSGLSYSYLPFLVIPITISRMAQDSSNKKRQKLRLYPLLAVSKGIIPLKRIFRPLDFDLREPSFRGLKTVMWSGPGFAGPAQGAG